MNETLAEGDNKTDAEIHPLKFPPSRRGNATVAAGESLVTAGESPAERLASYVDPLHAYGHPLASYLARLASYVAPLGSSAGSREAAVQRKNSLFRALISSFVSKTAEIR